MGGAAEVCGPGEWSGAVHPRPAGGATVVGVRPRRQEDPHHLQGATSGNTGEHATTPVIAYISISSVLSS